MGIGETAVTILSETGVPTPVVQTRMTPPVSRMGPADDVDRRAKVSPLWGKYGERVDNQSAREMLAERIAKPPVPVPAVAADAPAAPDHAIERADQHLEAAGAAAGGIAALGSFLKSKQGKQLQNQVVRGVFGLLKKNL
jgi:hypothetical protein